MCVRLQSDSNVPEFTGREGQGDRAESEPLENMTRCGQGGKCAESAVYGPVPGGDNCLGLGQGLFGVSPQACALGVLSVWAVCTVARGMAASFLSFKSLVQISYLFRATPYSQRNGLDQKN